jgi:flavin-dependent thymidylate synthase
MKVRLVGTNIELAAVRNALSGDYDEGLLSPEPIAAAYARISRSEKSVEELRLGARKNVARARRSNANIVFEMGHSSIAEHAVFNFDIEGISRLAIEALQHSRLASYTEKSQRYVLIGKDYVVPAELGADPALGPLCEETIAYLFDAYGTLYSRLKTHLQQRHPEASSDPALHRELETRAREDSRYLLPLAATGQLGMTINARSLGLMVRRLKGADLEELRHLGETLEDAALAVAPSLIRHTEPTAPQRQWDAAVPTQRSGRTPGRDAPGPGDRVRLLHCTPGGDSLLRAVLASLAEGERVEWTPAQQVPEAPSAIDAYYGIATPHSPAPRIMELIDLVFEIVCSACCFGQLKRHRMATILPAPYESGWGLRIPPLVAEAGATEAFLRAGRRAAQAHDTVLNRSHGSAPYLLTNGHCRRVIFKLNLRELYHFTRLRMDAHAQWEIRELATSMAALTREILPASARYLGGKDTFSARRAGT